MLKLFHPQIVYKGIRIGTRKLDSREKYYAQISLNDIEYAIVYDIGYEVL